jgi:hypothetical protein
MSKNIECGWSPVPIEPGLFIPLPVVLRQLNSIDVDDFATAAVSFGVPGRSLQDAIAEVLRPSVLQEIERFIRINQPPAAVSGHGG